MADLSDVFVAIPGGWGTLEELAEILTWKQLGLIPQPVVLLNTQGFYDSLISQMQQMVNAGFLSAENYKLLKICATPQELLEVIIP